MKAQAQLCFLDLFPEGHLLFSPSGLSLGVLSGPALLPRNNERFFFQCLFLCLQMNKSKLVSEMLSREQRKPTGLSFRVAKACDPVSILVFNFLQDHQVS